MIQKVIIVMFLLFFILPKYTEAKILPQAQKSTKPKTISTSKGSGIGVYPKLRADKRALTVNFSNLQNAFAVSYMLTYNTFTQEEGAMGAINLTGSSSASQELLFGTCSKNVCRYHSGIKDMKLDISYTLKSGKKYLKKYRIKI